MRYTVVSALFVLICIVSGWRQPTLAETTQSALIVDPLLGLRFNPDEARFTEGDSVLAQCPEARGSGNWTRKGLIFAKEHTSDGDVFIIGGLFQSAARKETMPDNVGVVIRISANGCHLIGPAAEPFQDVAAYSDVLPKTTIDGLAADAAQRYATAFGGTAAFLKLAKQEHVSVKPPQMPVLAKAIASLPR